MSGARAKGRGGRRAAGGSEGGARAAGWRTLGLNLGLPTTLTVLLFAGVLTSPQAPQMLAVLGSLAFGFGIAPLLCVALGLALGLSPWTVFAEVALADLIMVAYPALNFDLLERVPRLGPWVSRAEAAGRRWLGRWKWLSRVEFAGLVAFKMIPVEGTGSVATAVVGRLLGLGPWTVVAAATLGSIARTAIVVWAFNAGLLALRVA